MPTTKNSTNAARNRAIVKAIVKVLDAQTWSPDTLDQIAGILRAEGYDIREPEGDACACGYKGGPVILHGSADPSCPACGADWEVTE